MMPIAKVLKKMGESWDGEEQTDNSPDPDDNKTGGIGGLFGSNSGKKRYFIGFTAPIFRINKRGEALIPKASIWLELWHGKKGTLHKGKNIRAVELSEKPAAKINIQFAPDGSYMQVEGVPKASARNAKEMQAMLTQLWKQDAFKVRK
jgi:hypothetical protein